MERDDFNYLSMNRLMAFILFIILTCFLVIIWPLYWLYLGCKKCVIALKRWAYACDS